jgi:hypothetical protein
MFRHLSNNSIAKYSEEFKRNMVGEGNMWRIREFQAFLVDRFGVGPDQMFLWNSLYCDSNSESRAFCLSPRHIPTNPPKYAETRQYKSLKTLDSGKLYIKVPKLPLEFSKFPEYSRILELPELPEGNSGMSGQALLWGGPPPRVGGEDRAADQGHRDTHFAVRRGRVRTPEEQLRAVR